MTDKEKQSKDTWDIVLMATYFLVPVYGLRIAAENFLMEDDLGMGYSMLFGLIGGVTTTIYMTILKPKSLKIKLIGLAVVLLFVTILNLLVKLF